MRLCLLHPGCACCAGRRSRRRIGVPRTPRRALRKRRGHYKLITLVNLHWRKRRSYSLPVFRCFWLVCFAEAPRPLLNTSWITFQSALLAVSLFNSRPDKGWVKDTIMICLQGHRIKETNLATDLVFGNLDYIVNMRVVTTLRTYLALGT